MKKRWWFAAGAIVLAGGGWWYSASRSSEPSYETISVTRGDIKETVSVSAALVASDDIDLAFEITGRVKNVAVKEGQDVAEGDTLATVDSVSLAEEVVRAKAALDRARAEAMTSDDAVREASESEKDAKAYAQTVEDLENQRVTAADLAYDNAKDYEKDAESYYRQVVSESGESSATAKSARLTWTTAINNRKAAQEAKDTARKSRTSATRSAQNAWSAAREKVETLTSSAQDTIESSAVRSAEASYRVAVAGAQKTTLKAPVNGQITKVNFSSGEVVGSSVATPFGTLLSYDLLLEAKIPESDVAHVRIGQMADISFDAFDAGDIASAEVVEIEPGATVIQDVVYYKAKLRLSGIDARRKPGMTGDADIHIDEKRGVLRIPGRLLAEEGGKRTTRVLLSDGSVETRDVSVGLRGDDGIVEILSGLSEGDRVISETKK